MIILSNPVKGFRGFFLRKIGLDNKPQNLVLLGRIGICLEIVRKKLNRLLWALRSGLGILFLSSLRLIPPYNYGILFSPVRGI